MLIEPVMFSNYLAKNCCILNGGGSAWAFEPLAVQLASCLGVEVSESPRSFNYLLSYDNIELLIDQRLFIPLEAIRLASDKRLLASVFCDHGVPTPKTRLIENFEEALKFARANSSDQWCLKYPIGCGANGHRMLVESSPPPPTWPRPLIVQEFIQLERPEVYRMFWAAGEMAGWIARRFPEGGRFTPWVAHAQGARYERLGEPPASAVEAARSAVTATDLLSSFGCVDMLRTPAGDWVVLEVGTDGLFNHVDRDFGDPDFKRGLCHSIAKSFWESANQAAERG